MERTRRGAQTEPWLTIRIACTKSTAERRVEGHSINTGGRHCQRSESRAVKEERDSLESIVALLAATLSEDARAETAVRVSQSCNSPRAVESFCRLVVNYGALTRYTTSSESDLRRLQTARDSNGILVRAVLAVNYAAPAKPQAPAVFIPDTRSADEKLRDAKASVR